MQRLIKSAIMESYDSADRYGSVMAARYSIAAALHLRNLAIPKHWQYCPSPFMTEEIERSEDSISDILLTFYDDDAISDTDLIHAGNVLERLDRRLDRLDYSY